MINTFGKSHRIVLAACGALWLAAASGCNEPPAKSQWETDHPVPSRQENIQHGRALLSQAESAESRGDHAAALAHYNELRSLPDYARPQDLEQRIRAVRSNSTVWPPASQPSM